MSTRTASRITHSGSGQCSNTSVAIAQSIQASPIGITRPSHTTSGRKGLLAISSPIYDRTRLYGPTNNGLYGILPQPMSSRLPWNSVAAVFNAFTMALRASALSRVRRRSFGSRKSASILLCRLDGPAPRIAYRCGHGTIAAHLSSLKEDLFRIVSPRDRGARLSRRSLA